MSFGIGVGGFLQGLLEARQRAQQQAVQQQQLTMQQQAQQAEQQYHNRSLQQQGAEADAAQKAEAKRLALSQIQYYQGIVSDTQHHSPGEVAKAGAYLNHLWDQNPDLDPRQQQQAQAGAPQQPGVPGPQLNTPAAMANVGTAPQLQMPNTTPQMGFHGAMGNAAPALFGNADLTIRPPVEKASEMRETYNAPQLGPPVPASMQQYQAPPSAAPAGQQGAAAPPGNAGPQMAAAGTPQGGPQAPVDPLVQGFQHSIAAIQQQLDNPPQGGWSPDHVLELNSQINQLQQGIAARAHQMAGDQREAAESQSKIAHEGAESAYLKSETAAKPEEMKAKAIQARADAVRALAELQKVKSDGQPTPADKIRGAELLHKIQQDQLTADHWNKEYQRQTGNDAFNQFKGKYELTQKDQELGQKEPQAVTQARAAKIKLLMNSALDPITKSLDIKKVPALMSAVDRLSQQTGSPVSIQELAPPGIASDIWNAVNSPGFDPHKAIAAAMAAGRKDYAGQLKTAMGLAGRMQGHLQKTAAGMQRPTTSLNDPLGLANNP